MKRKLLTSVYVILSVVVILFLCFWGTIVYSQRNYNVTVDDFQNIFEKNGSSAKHKLMMFETSSSDTFEVPLIYEILFLVSSRNFKQLRPPRRRVRSFAFTFAGESGNDFVVVTHCIDRRIYEIDVLYESVVVKADVDSWRNYLLLQLPKIENAL